MEMGVNLHMSLQGNQYKMLNYQRLYSFQVHCTCHKKLVKFAFFAGFFCLQVASSTCKDFF